MDSQHSGPGPFADWSPPTAGPVAGPRSASSSNDWTGAVGDIDALVQNYQNASPLPNGYTGNGKARWAVSGDHPTCMSPGCDRRFRLTDRPHHCRRCGGVFCARCSCHWRQLNALGHPDPTGRPRKVCVECFSDPQTLGQCRSLSAAYRAARWTVRDDDVTPGQDTTPRLRSRLDAESACQQLLVGFRDSLPTSPLRQATAGFAALIQTPRWQLPASTSRERLVERCRGCDTSFTLLVSRYFCSVCGDTICSSCGKQRLLLYVPNGEADKLEAQWAIIYVVGCPAQEPDRSMCLRICAACCTVLSELQTTRAAQHAAHWAASDSWQGIEAVATSLRETQAKIDCQLPKYQELIDSLDISLGAAKCLQKSRSNTQTLAKAQGDLSDHFTKFVTTINDMKMLKPSTRGQARLTRNLLKSKIEFYQENMFAFRDLKRRLAAFSPPGILSLIQTIVDKNAINSCYVSLKQLALETLHLNLERRLSEKSPPLLLLTDLEQVALEELESSVRAGGDNWDEHVLCVGAFVKLQIKEHPLLRVSSSIGAHQVSVAACRRTEHLLRQIKLQFESQSADRSFARIKGCLSETVCKLAV